MNKWIWIVVLMCASGLSAQVNNPSVRYVAVAPSGYCGEAPPVQVINSSGAVCTCGSNTWTCGVPGSGTGGPFLPLTGGTLTGPLNGPLQDQGGAVFNIKAYGGVGDGILFDDCAIPSGSHSVTCAAETFTSADVGKLFGLYGAGTSSGLLATTISGFTSTHVVTLTDAAATTVTSGGLGAYGTDNATAIAAWKAVLPAQGGSLFVPSGTFLTSAQLTIQQSYVTLEGEGSSSSLVYAGSGALDAFVKIYPSGTPDTSCSTSTGCLFRETVQNLVLRGNANTSADLLTIALTESTFKNVFLRDSLTDLYLSQFGVGNHYYSVNVDGTLIAGSPQNLNGDALMSPVNGIHLSSISVGAGTGQTDWHGTYVRGASSCGVLIDDGFSNGFFGGTAFVNGTGLCLNTASGSLAGSENNSFFGWDVEQNTTWAINTNGQYDTFQNMHETASGGLNVGASAKYEQFLGGHFAQGCTIASGALGTYFNFTNCTPFLNSSTSTTQIDYSGNINIGNGLAIFGIDSTGASRNIFTPIYGGKTYFGAPNGTTGVGDTVLRSSSGHLDAGTLTSTNLGGYLDVGGDINLVNSASLFGKTTGGTAEPLILMYSDDNTTVGWYGNTILRSGNGGGVGTVVMPGITGHGSKGPVCVDASGNVYVGNNTGSGAPCP